MKYKMLNETDTHFELEHEKDGPFMVAKKGLDDHMIGKIKKMFAGGRVGYADGGRVEPPSLYSQTDTDFSIRTPQGEIQTIPKNFDDPDTLSLYNKASQQAEKEVETFQKKTMADQTVAPKIEAPVIETPTIKPPVATQAQPMMPGYLESTKKMFQPTAPQAITQPTPLDPLAAAYDQSYKKMQAAQMGIAKAQEESQKKQAEIYARQEEERQRIQDVHADNLAKLDQESKTLFDNYMSGKIDPNRVWNSMSTGNKVLAGISVLLGGLSQGLTGGKSNPAMDVIDAAIDRDIDAQKANLGKYGSLLSFNMQKYNRLDTAMAATRLNLLDITQAQINQSAAKMNSKIAIDQAAMANAELEVKKNQLKQAIANQQSINQVTQAPGGIPRSQILKLPEEQRKSLVLMDNGNYYQAVSEKDAETVKKAREQLIPAEKLFNRVKAFMDTEGVLLPGESKKGEAETLTGQMINAIKELNNLGVMSDSDKEEANNMIPQLTDITFKDKDRAKINTLIDFVNQKKNMFYQNYIPNYTPSQIQQTKIQ